MNKVYNTLALTLFSVLSFAQRPDRGGRFDEFGDAPGDGGQFTPIDNYTMLLIAMAVLIIGYVVYKNRQAKIA